MFFGFECLAPFVLTEAAAVSDRHKNANSMKEGICFMLYYTR